MVPVTIRVETERVLTALNTLRLPSIARWYIEARDDDGLREAIAFADTERRPLVVLGGGSNVVLAPRIDAVVVRMASTGIDIAPAGDDTALVRVAAGEPWHPLVQTLLGRGWHGLENLALIPGSAGAAPVQNIGAYGVELDGFIDSVDIISLKTGESRRLGRGDCAFGYRDSAFKHRWRGELAITAVTLKLSRSTQVNTAYADLTNELEQRGCGAPTPADVFDAVVAIRRRKLPDPQQVPNAGSFFKNPVVDAATFERLAAGHPGIVSYPQPGGARKLAAAWLVDRAGFRGYERDGVAMHERQALVLVNRGAADADAVLAFADEIRAAVAARFGVALEREPVLVGADGHYA